MNISGGKSKGEPIHVTKVFQGGAASRAGNIRVGDVLLSVNGTDVENETLEKCIEYMRTAGGVVELVVVTPEIPVVKSGIPSVPTPPVIAPAPPTAPPLAPPAAGVRECAVLSTGAPDASPVQQKWKKSRKSMP
jgi:hypothetical protein